jgi:hypothetical protein
MKNPTRWTTRAAVLGALGLAPAVLGQTLFHDNFDTDSSAAWTVYTSSADNAAFFAYDYSVMGIPSAPNSTGGTTLGLKFTSNMELPAAVAGLNAVPIGQNFTGYYAVRFDLWMNANGPFPVGGAGSTELASMGIGLAGNGAVQWSGGAPAGTAWFGVSGEGGAAQDFRAYVGGTLQPEGPAYFATGASLRDNGNIYYAGTFPGGQTPPLTQQNDFPQQTGGLSVGTVGFAWRQVEITRIGDEVTWSIDGLPIAGLTGSGNGISLEGNISVGYFDPFTSVSDNAALSFGLIDNVRVEVIPEPGAVALGVVGVVGLAIWGRRRTN